MSTKFKLPTETVLLPSKGLLYPEDSPLSKGELEMKYMTAKEEDILTNSNYINNGTVIDKLLQSLIVTENVNYDELLIGDKNAIMVAARILAYGKDYNVRYRGRDEIVDLSKLEERKIDLKLLEGGKNEFNFTMPTSKVTLTYKILTHADEKAIEAELAGLAKIDPEANAEVTTRLKFSITSVEGSKEATDIRNYVDNYLLASDARALRDDILKVSPDIDLVFYPENGPEGGVDIPIGVGFFWPKL